ncbi:MAG: ABC transporter ATP-binding protein [Oscillospiraceae bacterium]|nr:ABC transporter ATP-binding protein [Oscillospiraceae bacterium]
MNEANQYVIEMLHITKEFPGIKANDDITLQLKKGEIHALLGENGAGKSTLMSVLFGLYQPEAGEIRKDGKAVQINNPNDATALHIGMVHQHFKLVEVFTVLDNIILGAEDTKLGFLQKKQARKKVEELMNKYGLLVDLDAKVEDITVGMQQRTEILKMLYRDNEILIFDEPTAVLTPQEIDELMQIMKNLAKEGKSILFISHKLNEIMEVADRVTVLRKGKYVGTVNTKDTNKQELSNMMVGRPVQLEVVKAPAQPKDVVLHVENMCVASKLHKRNAVNNVSFDVRAGEIVCIAGIDGNGQTEFVFGLTGLEPLSGGKIELCGEDISKSSVRQRGAYMSHIPEDRHKHGLVLDFTLEQNMVLQRYQEPDFQQGGFIRFDEVRKYAEGLIEKFDVRSGQGPVTVARSMSGGNQQKAIIARELDRNRPLVVAVQPTRGLDVGAIEYIHSQLVAQRDEGKAILLVSLELDEVLSLSDRILVMYEGEIVGELDPKKTTAQELGLYMAGAKRSEKGGEQA